MISDFVLRAPVRTNEVITAITVPLGKTSMAFFSEADLFVRKGTADAEIPDSNYVADGSASFPFAGGEVHESPVAGGDRVTFVAQVTTEGVLFIAFS